ATSRRHQLPVRIARSHAPGEGPGIHDLDHPIGHSVDQTTVAAIGRRDRFGGETDGYLCHVGIRSYLRDLDAAVPDEGESEPFAALTARRDSVLEIGICPQVQQEFQNPDVLLRIGVYDRLVGTRRTSEER